MGYLVTAPLIIASDDGGHQVYVYGGQPVPGNIPEKEIKRLLDGEFIQSDTAEDENSFPDGDPSDEWTVKQLRAYAQEQGIDLGKATAKPDIIAALA